MKIYLAARYSRRLELVDCKTDLMAAGHQVTSRWLLGVDQPTGEDGQPLEVGGSAAREGGQDCVADVRAADVLVAFTEPPIAHGGGRARGGRHVELGLALAWCLDVIVVGPRENVFCWLPQIIHVSRWDEVPGVLSLIAEARRKRAAARATAKARHN